MPARIAYAKRFGRSGSFGQVALQAGLNALKNCGSAAGCLRLQRRMSRRLQYSSRVPIQSQL